nr:RNA-directed DNA polymerase, eukaryota, nucleotide-binding alpha-beta plait domain protein [Tanacetum cinerariifolium]
MGEDWQEVPSRNHRRSNADDVPKVSKSVFVTNFPESVSARDLWRSCSVYGTVVDVFIPSKKSKVCKRFAFVRFIKVFNLDRLVENLCTIWISRYHLYANPVRFEGSHKSISAPTANAAEVPKKSFVPQLKILRLFPDYTRFSKMKVLDVKLNYLGGTWVLFEFCNNDTKVNFMNNIGINSWFQVIQDVSPDFVCDERIDNVTSESRPSLSHPPGFTPEGVVHYEMLGTVNEEMHSDSVGSKTIHNEGSMLGVMEDFIRIGQVMGYAMEGSVNDLAIIIGQQGDDNVIR